MNPMLLRILNSPRVEKIRIIKEFRCKNCELYRIDRTPYSDPKSIRQEAFRLASSEEQQSKIIESQPPS